MENIVIFNTDYLISKINSNNKTEQVGSSSNTFDLYLGGVSLNLNWATSYPQLFGDFLQSLKANTKLVTCIKPAISNELFNVIQTFSSL
jgi:hypothetical protein